MGVVFSHLMGSSEITSIKTVPVIDELSQNILDIFLTWT